MTKDQIAQLERIAKEIQPAWGTTDGRSTRLITSPDGARDLATARNALPRLLEERRRLLAALKDDSGDELDKADRDEDAIAFAEEPG